MNQQQIDQQRMLAQMLAQGQGQQQGQMVGRFYVPASPLNAFANAAGQVGGAYFGRKANQGQEQFDEQERARLTQALAGMTGGAGPRVGKTPEMQAAQDNLARAPLTELSGAVGQLTAQQLAPKPDKLINVPRGGAVFDPVAGKSVYQNPMGADGTVNVVKTIGPDGKVMYTREDQAAGMQAYTSEREESRPMQEKLFQFLKSLPENEQEDLWRVIRADKYVDTGAGPARVNPQTLVTEPPATPKPEYIENVGDVAASKAEGTSQGKAQTEAQLALADLGTQESILSTMMADPNFDDAVGWLDQYTGGVGEKFGSDEGLLGAQAERQGNLLVQQAAKAWKGAISDAELEMFKASVPQRGDSAPNWRKWYREEYLPMKAKYESIASGQAFQNTQGAPPAAPMEGQTTTNVPWSREGTIPVPETN